MAKSKRFSVACLLFASICGCTKPDEIRIRNAVVHFPRDRCAELNFTIEDPRKRGQHDFRSHDGSMRSGRQSASTPVEVYQYDARVVRLCKLVGTESVLLAEFDEKHGGFHGPNGEVTEHWGPLVTIPRLLIDRSDSLRIPSDDCIENYVFLLSAISEETGWRYYVVSREQIAKLLASNETLVVPDLLTLPKVDDDPELLGLLKFAEQYVPPMRR